MTSCDNHTLHDICHMTCHMTQDLSDDNLLSLDVGYYEHAVNQTEWRDVREAMLGGGRGQRSLLTWSTLEREVCGLLGAWPVMSLTAGDVRITKHYLLLHPHCWYSVCPGGRDPH